jgi:hypothetical protein
VTVLEQGVVDLDVRQSTSGSRTPADSASSRVSARTGRESSSLLAICICRLSGLRNGDMTSWCTTVRSTSTPGRRTRAV